MTSDVWLGFFVLPGLAFWLGYYPVLNRLTVGLVSPYAKADLRKRLYAAAVDSLLVATTGMFAQILQSPWFLVAGGLYLLLRDSVQGQSLGKSLFGLVVISLETGKPATLATSVRRNLLLLLPGANIVAAFLETMTIVRDVQGQRLGDRLAHTQVIEGFGAKDLVQSLLEWWRRFLPEVSRAARPKRAPIVIDRQGTCASKLTTTTATTHRGIEYMKEVLRGRSQRRRPWRSTQQATARAR